MGRFFDRMFKFLEVEDKRQTNINRLFFILIVGWIGISFIINTVSQLIYYLVTIPSFEIKQSSFFWQIDIPKDQFTPLTVILMGVVAALFGMGLLGIKYVFSWFERVRKEGLEIIASNTRSMDALTKSIDRLE